MALCIRLRLIKKVSKIEKDIDEWPPHKHAFAS